MFDRVLTPAEVARESARTVPAVLAWVAVVDASRPDVPACAAPLGDGDRAALALAAARAGVVFVSDDARARRCAHSLSVQVRGSAGVVVDAKQRGLIDRVRPVIDALVEAGLYLGTVVIDAALREAGEA